MAEDGEGRQETWTHEETGLVAVSAVADSPDGGRAAWRLALRMADGGRCPGALAFAALADFGMLEAVPVKVPDLRQRVFALPVPGS